MSIKTSEWAMTKGIILNLEIDDLNYIGEEADCSYKVKIEYHYMVNNEKYKSKRIFFGDYIRTNTPRAAKKILENYSGKKDIDVYYNPYKPKSSVLEIGINSLIYRELLVGLLFVIVSIVFLRYFNGSISI